MNENKQKEYKNSVNYNITEVMTSLLILFPQMSAVSDTSQLMIQRNLM